MIQIGLFGKYAGCSLCTYIFRVVVIALMIITPVLAKAVELEEPSFVIRSFYIKGNHVLEKELLTAVVKDFTGEGKTAQDVEFARDALEKLYHNCGYPAVLVNIPEQTVDDGIVRLQVIESRIKRIYVKGNQYFTMENILGRLPGMQPGKVLFLPDIREQLSRINRNPDLKVTPVLIPGKELGTINVELNVEDDLPLHGSLELNNRSTHTTTETRLNGLIRYDNLWQRGHSISGQFQVSPQDQDEVMVFSASYSLPAPWANDHLLIGYFIDSDSDTASGEGFNVVGKGTIVGFRNLIPLPALRNYDHSLTLGFDWKDFEEDTQGEVIPVEYLPFSFGYVSSLAGRTGITQFSADLNFLIRDLFVNDMDKFQEKRSGSTGNYIYLTAGMERRQKLPKQCSLFLKLDSQIADQPLINNEQYSAGGVGSVRGYKESEITADNALHGTIELFAPDLLKRHVLIPYIFYDFAYLDVMEPLAGEIDNDFIHGAGIGLTGNWKEIIDFKLDLGFALEDTDDTRSGDIELHFKTAIRF